MLDVELAALLLGFHLILEMLSVNDAKLFSDSQAALSCVARGSGNATEMLLKVTRRALKKARFRAGGTKIRLQWCPEHRGLAGSELADREAKAAASGRNYPANLVPRFLLEYAPLLNPFTLKRELEDNNRSLAVTYWDNATTGQKYRI